MSFFRKTYIHEVGNDESINKKVLTEMKEKQSKIRLCYNKNKLYDNSGTWILTYPEVDESEVVSLSSLGPKKVLKMLKKLARKGYCFYNEEVHLYKGKILCLYELGEGTLHDSIRNYSEFLLRQQRNYDAAVFNEVSGNKSIVLKLCSAED